MRKRRSSGYVEISSVALALLGVLFATPGIAPAQSGAAARRIALTFDDVPASGKCDASDIRPITTALTETLRRRETPSAALVTPVDCVPDAVLEETLARWQRAGATIGNHSFSHFDLNGTSSDVYLDDIRRAQARIEAAGAQARWFRPPYLHTGADTARKRDLSRYLAEHSYRLAPVTIDNQEWVYAAVYERALDGGDDDLATRVVRDYLRHLEESVEFYENLSEQVFGRQIPQILLLHANRLNADHLDPVMSMLARRGYEFVSLERAMADSAYSRADPYVGTRGLSWIQRWAIEEDVDVPDEPREHEWVSRAFHAGQSANAEGGEEAAPTAGADVRAALRQYLAGHATGRAAHFDSAFHASARLYWVDDGDLRTRSAADYIAGAPGQPAADEEERERQITWVEVEDGIAVARIDLKYPAARFTDYMGLVRVGDRWQIIAKLFDRAAPASDPSGGGRDPRSAITAASRAFSEAFVAGDTAAIRDLYTSDAVLLPPDGEVRGRDAIVRYFAPRPGRSNVTHSMESTDLRTYGDMAIDAGTWHNTVRVDGGPRRPASGRYLVIWRKDDDDRWRIEYDAWHRP